MVSRVSSICVNNGLTGSRSLSSSNRTCVCVRRMLLLSRAVALIGHDELGPFDVCFVAVPRVCTVASSRKQGNSARACSFFCCVASIEKVVCIIGWHVCERSRVICVFFAQCFFFGRSRCVSSCCRESTSSLNCIDNIFLLYSHIADLC